MDQLFFYNAESSQDIAKFDMILKCCALGKQVFLPFLFFESVDLALPKPKISISCVLFDDAMVIA